MKIELKSNNIPTEPGYYLWRGKYSGGLELLDVMYYPARLSYGLPFGEYLGVANHRGRNIAQYQGDFSDKLELSNEN